MKFVFFFPLRRSPNKKGNHNHPQFSLSPPFVSANFLIKVYYVVSQTALRDVGGTFTKSIWGRMCEQNVNMLSHSWHFMTCRRSVLGEQRCEEWAGQIGEIQSLFFRRAVFVVCAALIVHFTYLLFHRCKAALNTKYSFDITWSQCGQFHSVICGVWMGWKATDVDPTFSSRGDQPQALWDERWLVGPGLPDLWNDCRAAPIQGPRRASQKSRDGEKDSDRTGGIWQHVQQGGERPLFLGKFGNCPTGSWIEPQSKHHSIFQEMNMFCCLLYCSCWPRTQTRGWGPRAPWGQK